VPYRPSYGPSAHRSMELAAVIGERFRWHIPVAHRKRHRRRFRMTRCYSGTAVSSSARKLRFLTVRPPTFAGFVSETPIMPTDLPSISCVCR